MALGLSIDTNMKADLCVRIVKNARYGIVQSMNSAGGRCHDNARCESMWARMKDCHSGSEVHTVEELKYGNGSQMLAGFSFALPCGADLLGSISGVHFVKYIADSGIPAVFAAAFQNLLLRRDLSRGFYAKKHDFIKMIQIHIIQTVLRE